MWKLLIIFLFILSLIVTNKIKYNNYKIYKLFNNKKIESSSLCMSLGTKIGVGSIIGTASSIVIGGYQSIIWMLIFSFVTSSLIYIEAYFGKKYNINNVSGPYYILKYGLNSKILSIISLIVLILTYSFLFQMIQTNTISDMLNINYNISKNIVFIAILVLLLITISFGIKDIITVMNKIVPIMCMLFIIISVYGIINNIDILFTNIKLISFDIKSILSGLIIGVKRSVFMNETLIGTTSISSGIDNNNIETSSLLQVIGSYFISFIITIIIALVLIIYNNTNPNYIILISNAYKYISGSYGLLFLTICMILFGITTMLSGYYICKSNINQIVNKKYIDIIFSVLFIIIVLSGIFINNIIIWKYLDYLMFIMIIINSYSIIKLLGSEQYDRK